MNDHRAGLIAQRVSEYLGMWNDRQSPFLRDLIDDPACGRQRQRDACQAFHSGVIRPPEVPEDLKAVPRDEYETYAFLRLLCPDHVQFNPEVDLNGLLRVLRCAFPDGPSRYQMIPQFVLAYGCGNWRDGAPWPDAVAALARMIKAASSDARRYVLDHVYGAGQYADNPAVLRAAKKLSRPPAHIVKPLHIQNTAQFAEALVGNNRQPILVETGAVLRMTWLFDHVEIPALATRLKAGAKRVFACTTKVTITTSNGPLDAQAGEFLIIAARERGFDVIVTDASGVAKGSRKLRGGTAEVQGHAELELSNCQCGSEACSSRHALRAWSPRSFDRLTFPSGAPRSAGFFWDGAVLQVRGVAKAAASIQVDIGDDVVLAFAGVANRRPRLHLTDAAESELRRQQRIYLKNDAGVIVLTWGAEKARITLGGSFRVSFQFEDKENPSIVWWRCGCLQHIDDPWRVPAAEAEADPQDKDEPIGLRSFVGTAINGGNWPLHDPSFSRGMYFSVANDTGFDLEGRLHCAAITQYICSEHDICRKHRAFEGPSCRGGNPFDAAAMRIEKKEGRVILIETYEEREENQHIQDVKAEGTVLRKRRHRIDDDPEEENAAFSVAVPPPYPNNEEFLRCARCKNYYKITEESLKHHANAVCEHVKRAKPLRDRLREAGSDGDVAAALVLEEMLRESSDCKLCPPSREDIKSIPWCPLTHAPRDPEPALTRDTTIMWVRRDR